MKQKLKTIPKLITVFMLILLSSCEKDLYENSSSVQTNSRFTASTKKFKDLNSNFQFREAFKLASSKMKSKTINGKLMYDVDVDTSIVNEVTADNYTSYSFQLTNQGLKYNFENLFVQINSSGKTSASILKYNLDNTDQIELIEETVIIPRSDIETINPDGTARCVWLEVTTQTSCSGAGQHFEGEVGCVPQDYSSHTHLYMNCGGGDGPGYAPVYDWSSTHTPSNTNPGGIAFPVNSINLRKMNTFINNLSFTKKDLFENLPQSTRDIIFNYFVANNFLNGSTTNVNSFISSILSENLTPYFSTEINIIDMTQEHETNINNMLTFLIQNNFSPQSVSFVKEMISAAINNVDIDTTKDIIYGINKPCQKAVVKSLMDSCSPFTQLINQTFNSTATANITFSNNTTPSGNAYTNPFITGSAQNFTIKIVFDNAYLDNATNLSIAASTLHELVHAYLMNLYLTHQLVATNSSYNALMNAFIAFYDNQVQDTFDPLDNEIHNAMKDFISKMANSLYNYANANNIPNVTPAYCEKLAWGTMYGTDLFKNVLTPQQQQDYGNIAATEQDHLPGSKGTNCP